MDVPRTDAASEDLGPLPPEHHGLAIVTTTLLAGAAMTGGAFLVDRVALATIRPRHKTEYDTDPETLQHPTRPIEFASSAGTLRGWVMEPRDGARGPLAMLVHGWSANSGTVLRLAGPLLASGHPVMAFDVRGHGRSDPAPFVTIRHYRDDVATAVHWAARELPYERRVLVGHSMGGAASALVAATSASVHGVGLVASPADIMDVTRAYLSESGLPGSLVVRLCIPSWRLRAAESFKGLNPEASMSRIEVPIRIVQGLGDRRVTPDHARRLAAAAGVSVTEVPDYGHTDVLDSNEARETLGELMREASS